MSDYDVGFRDGVEAAARALEYAAVSPADAVTHWRNAGSALRYMASRGKLSLPRKIVVV